MARDLDVIGRMGLTLTYVINTHVHADHITSSGMIKQSWPKLCEESQGRLDVDSPPKSAISEVSKAECDVPLVHNGHLCIGDRKLYCVSTRAYRGMHDVHSGRFKCCLHWRCPSDRWLWAD